MPENDYTEATGVRYLTPPVKRLRPYLVISLLLLAIALRMIYAYDLPQNSDELNRLQFIKTVSIQPGKMNLPIGSTQSIHTVLTAYIATISFWLMSGSVYGMRIIFILLSAFGLIGLFYLTRELFDDRAAILALLFGATDHHLISYSPLFLEYAYLCLTPWLILVVYRAVELERKNYWIIMGIIGGVGYMSSEIFLLLSTLPTVITVLSSGKVLKILKTRQLYIGLLALLIISFPNIIWSYKNQFCNITRHVESVNPIGFTPRMALLYLGDLLINLKNSSWIVLNLGNRIYGPWTIPCHWISGLLYLFSLCYALKNFRDRRHRLLFVFIFGAGMVVSLVNAKEPWSYIEWGAMTIFPIICLTAWTADQFIVNARGRVIYLIFFMVISAYTATFLYGPKYGYASPLWEKAFLGDIIYYSWIKNDNKTSSEVVEKVIAKHPESAIAHYFRGELASDPLQKTASFQKALSLEPFNPLVCETISRKLIESNRNAEAFRLLSDTVSRGHDCFTIQFDLSEAASSLGNYAEAENHLKKALKIKPDSLNLYHDLFYVIAMQGRFEESLDAFERYAMSTVDPGKEYQVMSQALSKRGEYAKAGVLYRKALEKNSDLPATPPWKIVE